MMGRRVAIILVMSFALASSPLRLSPVLAASPRIVLTCGAPVGPNGLVTCRLAGQGFHPHEAVQIVYRVQAGANPTFHQTSVYHRQTRTDGQGAFRRPLFRFALGPWGSFRLTVMVTGQQGDRAGGTAVGIA